MQAFSRDVVGYEGKIDYNPIRPDGTPRKLLDSGRLRLLGWHATTPLSRRLVIAYDDFQAHIVW